MDIIIIIGVVVKLTDMVKPLNVNRWPAIVVVSTAGRQLTIRGGRTVFLY